MEIRTFESFLEGMEENRRAALIRLRQTLLDNLPWGFEEIIHKQGISYVVPYSLYPAGYHCPPPQPLPFIEIRCTKSHIALHHLGLYANPSLTDWFVAEYGERAKTKLDMGKGCVRFKKPDQIPYDIVAELMQKMSPEMWINLYETAFKK